MTQIYKIGDISKSQLVRELAGARGSIKGLTFFYRLAACEIRTADPDNWLFSVIPAREVEDLDKFIASGERAQHRAALLESKKKKQKVNEDAKD